VEKKVGKSGSFSTNIKMFFLFFKCLKKRKKNKYKYHAILLFFTHFFKEQSFLI
jgi:hypothetical protein